MRVYDGLLMFCQFPPSYLIGYGNMCEYLMVSALELREFLWIILTKQSVNLRTRDLFSRRNLLLDAMS